MTTHVNDSGTWRTLIGVHVNDSGTWRTIQQVYVNDSGTWRTVFVNATVALTNQSFSDSQSAASVGTATAGVRLTSGGDINSNVAGSYTDIGDWVTPTSAASNYSARATLQSGAAVLGDSVGSWLPLTSNREWKANITGSSPGSSSSVVLVEIALTSDTATVLTSATYTLSVTLT